MVSSGGGVALHFAVDFQRRVGLLNHRQRLAHLASARLCTVPKLELDLSATAGAMQSLSDRLGRHLGDGGQLAGVRLANSAVEVSAIKILPVGRISAFIAPATLSSRA